MLPKFSNVECPSEHNAYDVCIEVDYQDGGDNDLFLLDESPWTSILLTGHLENEPKVKAVVILADEDNPKSNTVSTIITNDMIR